MASTDEEIRVAITARADEYNAAMAQVEADTEAMRARVAEEAAAFNTAQQAKFDALMRLGTAFRSGLVNNEALAEAEGALDQAMAAGALTAQEYAGYIARLDAAEVELTAATAAATTATEANTAALTVNGGVAREVGVLIGELARGNYHRLEGSTITLANRTGILSRVFSPLGVGIMGAAGAALFLGDQFLKAQETADAFNRALLVTGDLVGTTSGELNGLAMQIGTFTGNTAQADEIVQKLAQSGKLSGQTLQYAAQAAANAMQLTGESADQAAREVESLAGDPTKTVVALNGKYHFLTLEIYEQISKLQAEGDAFGAAEVAAKAFADSTSDRLDQLTSKMGFFERQISDFKTGWDAIDQGLRKAFDPTLEEQSAAATHKAVQAQYALNEAIKAYGNIGGDDAKQAIATARQYAEETRKAALALRDKVKAQQEDAQQQAKVGQQNTRLIQEVNEQEKLNQHLKETSLLQEKIAEEKRRVEDIHKADAGSSSIKGINFDASGAVSGGQQWDAIVKKLTQEYSNAGVAARHAASEAKEASRQIVETFEMQRAQAAAASQQRIQIDAQMMDRVAGLYGQNSEQYRRALQERLSDTRAYVAAVEQAEKQREQQEEASYKDGEQEAMTRVQSAFAHLQSISNQKVTLGEMTAQQQIALEQDYANREYQIELSILQRWADTFKGRPRVVEQVNRQIEELNRRHQQQLDALQEKADQKRVQEANKWLQPINQAFSQSIAGMIQGTQTFHQAWQHMLQSILLSYIQTEIATLTQHEATEQAKSSATAAGTTERNTIQAAGAAVSKAIDATTGMSQITTAAATGAAKAYQAIVGIPYVGPILAPIAAGVTFAGIEAFGGKISSAAGGWDRVPVDDAPALLHRNEMVLPANLAERVRGMTEPGGGGDTHHYHFNVQAWDATGVRDMLRRNPHLFAEAAQHAKRKGY
jgi:phage-related minor tail protein